MLSLVCVCMCVCVFCVCVYVCVCVLCVWQMECSTVYSVVMGWIRYPLSLQSSTLPSYAVMEIDPLTTTQLKHCTSYFKDCVPSIVQ